MIYKYIGLGGDYAYKLSSGAWISKEKIVSLDKPKRTNKIRKRDLLAKMGFKTKDIDEIMGLIAGKLEYETVADF